MSNRPIFFSFSSLKTAGIFLASTAQAPKDIPATVAQASAAASNGIGLLSQDVMLREPTTAMVDDRECVACFECEQMCAYQAIEHKEILDRNGDLERVVAWSNPAMCEGCGVCVVTCRGNNIELQGSTGEQLFAQLNALAPRPEAMHTEVTE